MIQYRRMATFTLIFCCFNHDIIPHEYLNTVLVADAASVLILFITVAIFSKTRFSLIFIWLLLFYDLSKTVFCV